MNVPDETEYLTSSPANEAHLLRSIAQVRGGSAWSPTPHKDRSMTVPAEAVEAAAAAVYGPELDGSHHKDAWLADFRRALEAAYPIMLSHELEQTRIAHLDAMVNRETKAAELAQAWDEGAQANGEYELEYQVKFDYGDDLPEPPDNPYRSSDN